ncbi:uncharacterized protein E0L32_006829 [Thyridium curvatum]|uniref:Galactokinase n=1 Tax=Thyridium curvatum TaxID=1093900 RepID=A0A507AY30_9PEZI|nr:uncharacterized protein E0L32_006829 [Thyridium curvatum]TPX12417.1 hypothetical protein E0L32_006829 [Thyridium curvatum]
MSGTVPFATSLRDIYPDAAVDAQTTRWRSLLSKFEQRYGHAADFVARSPGRVNIIGEHIDYSLYSVLPMAITADCLIAVSTDHDGDDDENSATAGNNTYKIQIANVQDDKFPAHEFDIPYDAVEIDATVHEWTNYFKSGLRGALELLRRKRGADGVRPRSMRVLMDGTVPSGGGLSSSAAFTSTSALAVMIANGEKEVSKMELTELAIVSERAVGVNSGGMDQSASVFSERGSALFVSFSPKLSARPVSFPATNPELCFLIAQSFVAADKQVTGPIHYNLRVVECTLAACYLNAVLNPPGTQLPGDAGPLGVSLHGFHETFYACLQHQGHPLPRSTQEELAQLLELAGLTLTKEEGYTRAEIAAVLDVPVAELDARYTSAFPVRAERFKLRQRAMHVFAEALRVLRFMELLEAGPGPETAGDAGGGDTTAYNTALGELLNETQASCRDVYECSCPEIDELCAIARRAGSYGSRVTGAGWGGCSVHLVPADRVAAVQEAWDREYYSKLQLTPEQREAAYVLSRPGSGSAVFTVEGGSL